jgi:hypothetical protein
LIRIVSGEIGPQQIAPLTTSQATQLRAIEAEAECLAVTAASLSGNCNLITPAARPAAFL